MGGVGIVVLRVYRWEALVHPVCAFCLFVPSRGQ